jgi:hypothetical protein
VGLARDMVGMEVVAPIPRILPSYLWGIGSGPRDR